MSNNRQHWSRAPPPPPVALDDISVTMTQPVPSLPRHTPLAAQPHPVERAAQPRPVERAAQPRPVERAAQPRPEERAAQPRPVERAAQPRPEERAAQPRPARPTTQQRLCIQPGQRHISEVITMKERNCRVRPLGCDMSFFLYHGDTRFKSVPAIGSLMHCIFEADQYGGLCAKEDLSAPLITLCVVADRKRSSCVMVPVGLEGAKWFEVPARECARGTLPPLHSRVLCLSTTAVTSTTILNLQQTTTFVVKAVGNDFVDVVSPSVEYGNREMRIRTAGSVRPMPQSLLQYWLIPGEAPDEIAVSLTQPPPFRRCYISEVVRMNNGFSFVRPIDSDADFFLSHHNTRFGTAPAIGSLMHCIIERDEAQRMCAKEDLSTPLITLCTVVEGKALSAVMKSKTLEEMTTMLLDVADCPGVELPPVDTDLLCVVTRPSDQRLPALSAIGVQRTVRCIRHAYVTQDCVRLLSPAVDYGRREILMRVEPGEEVPPSIACWLSLDGGQLWASPTAPPQIPQELRFAKCLCQPFTGGSMEMDLKVTSPDETVAIVGVGCVTLSLEGTGLGCLPEPGAEIKCWLRCCAPGRWDAFMLPGEMEEWPEDGNLLQPADVGDDLVDAVAADLPSLDVDTVPQRYALPDSIRQELSRLYVAPAVLLGLSKHTVDANSPLLVVCDSDIVRISDRWNLDVDIVPLGGRRHWCQLMRFHTLECLKRFTVQLRFYMQCRKPNQRLDMLISMVPQSQFTRLRSPPLAGVTAPIFALDCVTAKSKDDALQIFEEADGDETVVVVRMYIATPFTEADVEAGKSRLMSDAFLHHAPEVLKAAENVLLDNFKPGKRMLTDRDSYGLVPSEERVAVCYEQRFIASKQCVPPPNDGGAMEDVYIAKGRMTVMLKPCRLEVALTFEQADAFEDGKLRLPPPVETSLTLLRRLVDCHCRDMNREKEAQEALDKQGKAAGGSETGDEGMARCRSSDVWLPHVAELNLDGEMDEEEEEEDEKPFRSDVEVRNEGGKFFRVAFADVPSAEKPRERLLSILDLFRNEQNVSLFLAYGFTLKSERVISAQQCDALNAKCDALGVPRPEDQTYDGYYKALNKMSIAFLLEICGSSTIETKVPILHVEEEFMSRLDPTTTERLLHSGAKRIETVPVDPLPLLLLTGGFLVSTKPLREYNHLLAQYLMLVLGCGRLHPSAERSDHGLPQVADAVRVKLMEHCLAASLELEKKRRSKNATETALKQAYLCNDELPYHRTMITKCFLYDIRAESRELICVARDIRDPDTNRVTTMTFKVSKDNKMLSTWPASFGKGRYVLLRSRPYSDTIDEVLRIPKDASLTDVLTDEDWARLLSPWQGRRLKQLIQADEAMRNVPKPQEPPRLVQGRLDILGE